MPDLTDEQLTELERLDAEGDGLPWYVEHQDEEEEAFSVCRPYGEVCWYSEGDEGDFDDEIRGMIQRNFALVAAARNALRPLIAEVRRQRRADAAIVVARTP